MEIYLTDLETGDRLRFPMIPEKINVQTGTIFQSYTILAIGEVKIPFGEELTGFSWSGILPGAARKKEPYITAWKSPNQIQSLWDVYRIKKKKLRLLVTGTPINHDVNLEKYDAEYSGGYGDYTYDISFVQAKDLKINVSKKAAASKPQTRPSPPPAKNYTVVPGDTLWDISARFLGAGSEYPRLYEANRDTIEAEAKRRGMSSSENGHWIFPGTVLIIPI